MSTTERTFPVDEQRLFSILIDPETYPHWLVGAKNIREVSADWPARGSDFRHVVGFGPLQLADRTTVVDLDPPSMLELYVRARPVIEAHVRFELTPHPEGCRLKMIETPAGLYKAVSPVAAPLVHARNARSLERLEGVVTRLAASGA